MDERNGYWRWPTRIGEARVVPKGGRFFVLIGDEDLGNYEQPWLALDDLTGGHTFSHSSGVDTSTLGLPRFLNEWEFVRS